VDEKVKTLKYRVNTGTWLCATHANETAGALQFLGLQIVQQHT